MKADEPDNKPAMADEETAGEGDEPSGRGPVVVLSVVGLVAIWRIIVVFPEVALVGGGVLGTLGWQRVSGWTARRRDGASEEQLEVKQPDIGEALRRLIGDDKGVLLTVLRDDLNLPDTKAVKALLEAEDITWKPSRTRAGNGPAVRRESIPPAPSPVADSHGPGCCCRSGDNNNSNDSEPHSREARSRVRHIRSREALYDPNDNISRHTSTREGTS
ncbi:MULTISPECIES: hypothetical protein [unclassified Streptomyces]|uniref:hypothetical protein n=1 Tax=unclassified Streptomyces TaxID=2593676 RepID=UPI0019093A7E|nr:MULTISPECIES: hypothetical protein [unclassified Streptomyces]MBK3563206.1 hypothetical protein [Streptomyces sp. MBT62]MBK6013195.1 hypothetical protein [Streptomyces sp. MBT53]